MEMPIGRTNVTQRFGYAALSAWLVAIVIMPASAEPVLQGKDAYGNWQSDKPGTVRLIRPQDMPAPGATRSVANSSRVVPRAAGATPSVVPGFKIELLAEGLAGPRVLRIAPNGDIFIAETSPGRIRVLRTSDDGTKIVANEIFASGLGRPFGIAFFPRDNPQWVYVANTDSVVRFAYRAGDLKAEGKP